MPDLSSLTSASGLVGLAGFGNKSHDPFSHLLIVTPQTQFGIRPNTPTNPGGFSIKQLFGSKSFLFHIQGEESATLTSDITDHFIEDNTAIQDQITIKPEIITTSGYIGELNNVLPPGLEILKASLDKLFLLAPYMPSIVSSAQIAYNNAFQIYQIAAGVENAIKTVKSALGNGVIENEQQKAFNQFFGWWQQRELFQVQTPWAVFEDMAIQTIRASQDEESTSTTSFEITFKKMRFASTLFSSENILTGRASAQSSSQVNKGLGLSLDIGPFPG